MHLRGMLVVFLLAAAPFAAPAQTLQPPPGTPRTSPAPAPTAPTAPQPAPRPPVRQVAPLTAPLAPSVLGRPATPKPPPVVQPKGDPHAQKPPAKPAAKQAAKPPAKPATPPAAAPPSAAPPPPGEEEKAAEPSKGTATGQPLPRWASLRSDEVNLRTGPGTRYPVDWVYKRRDLPVKIVREFEIWRLIEDQDGVKGWVNQATLTGRRGFVVKDGDRTLRKSASDDATPVAILKPGVVGRIRACEAGKLWCDMQVGDYRGWLKRDDVWGLTGDEAVN
jgi:SH3-like domain-containing protein